jgi:Helix-turn-helix domain
MAYRAIFGVQMHTGDQILVTRLNGIREPFRVALERGMQRRHCDPPFQAGGLAIRVREYEACLNNDVSDEDQHHQCEDYASEETYERFHCFKPKFPAILKMLRSQVTAVLIRLHRLYLSTTSTEVQGYSTLLNSHFLLLLQKEEEKLQRTSFYTSALSVRTRVLVDAVLAETGKSPSTWIRDRTLLEARRLLTYTDLTISEIAYRLNFRNVSYGNRTTRDGNRRAYLFTDLKRFLKKSIPELASRLCASRQLVSTLDLAKNLRLANDYRFQTRSCSK